MFRASFIIVIFIFLSGCITFPQTKKPFKFYPGPSLQDNKIASIDQHEDPSMLYSATVTRIDDKSLLSSYSVLLPEKIKVLPGKHTVNILCDDKSGRDYANFLLKVNLHAGKVYRVACRSLYNGKLQAWIVDSSVPRAVMEKNLME